MSKRRPNGDGTVRKRPDGRWEARIIVGHKENKKPIYKSVFGLTQAETMAKFRKLQEVYRGVELTEDSIVTLNEWLDRWLAYEREIVRHSTIGKYELYASAYVRPYLGEKKISAIQTRDVQALYVKLLKEGRIIADPKKGKGLSGSTVRAVHAMLHNCFEMAVEQHIVVKNPTEVTTLPKLNDNVRQALNENQLKQFLEAIRKESWWYDLFYTECLTGLRRGELCGLRWEDFNAEDGTLTVKRQIVTVKGGFEIGDPKTDTGIRTIVLPKSVVNLLKERHERVGSEWIFPSVSDSEKPVNPNSVYGAFKRILKKEGLPDIPFHSLRHTYATNSTSAGIDEKTLAKNLGHKKAAFTYNQYTHVTEYMQQHASDITGDALENILGKDLMPWEDEKTDKD